MCWRPVGGCPDRQAYWWGSQFRHQFWSDSSPAFQDHGAISRTAWETILYLIETSQDLNSLTPLSLLLIVKTINLTKHFCQISNQNLSLLTVIILVLCCRGCTHHQLVAVHVRAPVAVFIGTTGRGVIVITRRVMHRPTFRVENRYQKQNLCLLSLWNGLHS